jgi:hypothetical protein
VRWVPRSPADPSITPGPISETMRMGWLP